MCVYSCILYNTYILQTLLRHPECESARQNRDGVFTQMRKALDNMHHIVTDGGPASGDLSPTMTVNGDSGISLAQHQPTAHKALKEFEVGVYYRPTCVLFIHRCSRLSSGFQPLTQQDLTEIYHVS